ncbi:MAG: hypothetical protein CMR00_12545 [[Chlorobium] sp. 445]|nr:MAG: hypothetical protein CMR00_12545 [[Chlorobium] sp. 445]
MMLGQVGELFLTSNSFAFGKHGTHAFFLLVPKTLNRLFPLYFEYFFTFITIFNLKRCMT